MDTLSPIGMLVMLAVAQAASAGPSQQTGAPGGDQVSLWRCTAMGRRQ